MSLTVYADVTSPECYHASRRVDALRSRGVEVAWCAIQARPRLQVTSRVLSPAEQDELRARFAELEALLRPGEELPWAMPTIGPSGEASVSAYAEAVGAGAGDDVRRLLFELYWRDGADIGQPAVLRSPLAGAILRGHSEAEPLRESGYVVSVDRGPITTNAYRRIRTWHVQWQQLGCPPLPVLLADAATLHGLDALRWLGKELDRVSDTPPQRLEDPRRYPPQSVHPSGSWISQTGGRWRYCHRLVP